MAIPKDLLSSVASGNCILFLGAGVHAPAPDQLPQYSRPVEERLPIGGELARRLTEVSDLGSYFEQGQERDLQRVSMCVEVREQRKGLIDRLNDLVRPGRPSDALSMLAALPFKIFVTTNFDLLLEEELRRVKKSPQRIVYDPSRGQSKDVSDDPTSERPLVFKMHGDLDSPDAIVITDEDYIGFIQRMSEGPQTHPVPQTVRFRMQKWPTVFVGYSLRDYNLRLLFRTLRWQLDSALIPRTFAVDPSPDPLIVSVWQDQRRFVTFVAEDLWTFVPELYRTVTEKEYWHERTDPSRELT